ncbi:MAG TPA: hypothetical protein VFP84_16860 [Kofleriaceae bacterium]|nr:hypothetical protein [Kofleriaceae bacterium]
MSPMSIHALPRFLVLACAGLTVLPACPLLDVTADAQEVCLTYPNLKVPAAGGETSLDQSFSFDDLSKIHDLTKLDASLEFTRAQVRATSGITDFSFIESAKLDVASGDPGSTLPTLTMYDCNGDCDPNGATLDIPANTVTNAVQYLRGDSIEIGVAFKGTLPSVAWTLDIDVCMTASASYSVAP